MLWQALLGLYGLVYNLPLVAMLGCAWYVVTCPPVQTHICDPAFRQALSMHPAIARLFLHRQDGTKG